MRRQHKRHEHVAAHIGRSMKGSQKARYLSLNISPCSMWRKDTGAMRWSYGTEHGLW